MVYISGTNESFFERHSSHPWNRASGGPVRRLRCTVGMRPTAWSDTAAGLRINHTEGDSNHGKA